jgi:hypothetical protein
VVGAREARVKNGSNDNHHRHVHHRNGHRPHHDPPVRASHERAAAAPGPHVARAWPVIVVGAFALGLLFSVMSLRR